MPGVSKKPMKRRAAKCPLAWAAEKLQCPQQPQFKGGEEDERQWTEWTGGGDGLAVQNLECQEERQQHCVLTKDGELKAGASSQSRRAPD